MSGAGGPLRLQLAEYLRRLQAEGVWGLPIPRSSRRPIVASASKDEADPERREAASGAVEATAPVLETASREPEAAPGGPANPPAGPSAAGTGVEPETAAATPGSSRPTAQGEPFMPPAQDDLFGTESLAGSRGRPGETLEDVEAEAEQCVACRLHETRNSVVFGVGDPDARLMFIGEGPGRDEDLQGEPFVGRAGQLLDRIIKAIGRGREDVYICNTVKCRPPENRNPREDELASCHHFLLRQVALVEPDVIVLLGRVAVEAVLGTNAPLSRLRGEFRHWHGIPVMCTYHPAYLLRNPNAKGMVWEDMQMVRDLLASRAGD